MNEKPVAIQADVTLGLNSVELHVLVYCVQSLENFFERKPPEDNESLPAVQSAMKKLVPAYLDALERKDPYDRQLGFSEEEQKVVGFALHMTMTDAVMAKQYGLVADDNVGPDVRLRDLAEYVPVMASLLRRLEVAQRLTYLERQVRELQAQLGS